MTLPHKNRKKRSIDSWLIVVLLSLCLHFFLLYQLQKNSSVIDLQKNLPEDYIKLKIDENKSVTKLDQEQNKILEAPLEKTKVPEKADFLGQNDHEAKKLMKVKPFEQEKAKDPGLKKKKGLAQENTRLERTPKGTDQEKKEDTNKFGRKITPGSREGYEDLLSESMKSITEQESTQGYMDHLEDLAEEGEIIDMNTREYRFIGYFTGLRKSIELVWVYPSDAAHRGIHGHVIVKFIILPDGKLSKVQIVESSGYKILDNAIVDAIRTAAPYAPLPAGFKKDRLVIRGSFAYILQ